MAEQNLKQHFKHASGLFEISDLLRLFVLTSLSFLLSGAKTLSAQSISGIINHYAAVSSIDSCSGKLSVSDTTGFRKGGEIYIFQMQGADISEDNNASFGTILNLNQCGKHERARIDSVGTNALFLKERLVNAYNFSAKVQAVSIAQYLNAVVSDTLRAMKWNGSIGGILALEVQQSLTLNAPLLVEGCGFRGGQAIVPGNNNCTWLVSQSAYVYGPGNWRGNAKGEGIAIADPNLINGRGPQSNGGGGGNDHNSGGGGGGHLSSGGKGGDNDEPSLFGCDGYFPGIGGKGITNSISRLFLGGGGGAGHTNNLPSGHGGAGGGIILLKAGQILGSNPLISARGTDGQTANGDGGGGGGAGGSIWLDCGNCGNVQVRADGGKGGSTINANADRCFGPGGGGAGGRILTNVPALPAPLGGDAGLITLSTNGCNGSNSGAENGVTGAVQMLSAIEAGANPYFLPQILIQPKTDTICPGHLAHFSVETNAGGWSYQWQMNNGAAWQNLIEGIGATGVSSGNLSVTVSSSNQNALFRCRVFKAGCYETLSGLAGIVVRDLPTADFSISLNSTTAAFSNLSSNALGYFWDFGDPASGANNFSSQENAQHTFSAQDTFLVRLFVFGVCDTLVLGKQVIVLLPPTADFDVPGAIQGCGSVSFTVNNLSSANSSQYSWNMAGANPSNSTDKEPVITYLASGTYTITLSVSNAAGSSSKTRIIQVTVLQSPTTTFNYTANGLNIQFNNNSQNASNYFWDFGDGMSSSAQNPNHVYAQDGSYSVVLTSWNACDTLSQTQVLNLLLPPTAAFSIPDSIFSCGPASVQPLNLAQGSISSYLWSFPGGTPASSGLASPTVVYNASGTYNITQTVSNAIGSDQFVQSFVVQVQLLPIAAFSFSALSANAFQFHNLSQNGLSYTWDFGDGSGFVNGLSPSHQFSQNGSYIVTLIASNACGASIYQQTLQIGSSGFESPDPPEMRLYPNPNSGRFYVECASFSREMPVRIQIFDLSGKEVWRETQSNPSETIEIRTAGLAAGVYQVLVDGGMWRRSGLVRVE